MPLLNFKTRFALRVKNGLREIPYPALGIKRQTIRAERQYPIRPGDRLYLYTGLRTKAVRKLGEADCTSVHKIVIYPFRQHTYRVEVDGQELTADQKDKLAWADGFDSRVEMLDWFERVHGLPFRGQVIKW